MRAHDWMMTLDIERYFASVPISAVIERLDVLVRCRKTVEVVRCFLEHGAKVYESPMAALVPSARAVIAVESGDSGPRGLPLGSLVSQWAGNFLLNDLDRVVTREFKPGAYLRYMDDFVQLDDRAERLIELREKVAEFLGVHYGLRLKVRGARVRATSEPAYWLGMRVSRGGVTPGRKQRRRMRAKLRQAARRGAEALERSLASYRGVLLLDEGEVMGPEQRVAEGLSGGVPW